MSMIPPGSSPPHGGVRDIWLRVGNRPLRQQHRMSFERQGRAAHQGIGDEVRKGMADV
jgi:hypothetical protein